jgi:hypothetical protein
MTKYVFWFSRDVHVVLLRFWRSYNILHIFSENAHKSKFIKIYPVGSEVFPVDRRRGGHDEANIRFS